MIQNTLSDLFDTDATRIQTRLHQRPSRAEFFALAFTLGMLCFFTWYHSLTDDFYPLDYGRYLRVADNDFEIHYYAYWSLPIFIGLAQLPNFTGFILWSLLGVCAVFWGARLFRGRATTVLLTYQMFYILFYGQIMALLIGGLALTWWGIARQKWHWAGLGLVIATTKYQTGLTFGLFLWLLAPISWRERLKILIVPLGVTAISLIVYPGWPLTSIETILASPPDDIGSITLWRWLGPFTLLFWLPPLLLPLSRERRFVALATTSAFALPYFQQTDLLFLYALPIFQPPWQLVLGNLGFILFWWRKWPGLWALAGIPLLIYLGIIGPRLYAYCLSLNKRFRNG